MSALDRVLEVAMLNAAYARCIDADRLEAWPDFFLDPCVYKVTTEENLALGYETGIIYADTRAMLADRITALRNANIYEQHRYRHLLGMPAILGEDGDALQAETPFAVFRIMRDGASTVFLTGRYLDRLRREGESLKIAERIVACDSSTIDTLLVIPL
jgi:3-phenylpropionate/cinnamic acid dioxygenase small subunit